MAAARSGFDIDSIQPRAGGRVPGWDAGVIVAHRHAQPHPHARLALKHPQPIT